MKTRQFGITAIIAFALAVGATACGDDDASTTDTGASSVTDATTTTPAAPILAKRAHLKGRTFISQSVEGRKLVKGTEIRLNFTKKRIGIDAGCNNMGGKYSLKDGVLATGPLATTEIACKKKLMRQDTWIGDLLIAGADATVDGDMLVLDGGEKGVITLLDREVAEPDLPLEGTTWTVDGLVSDQAISTTPAKATATLLIEDDTATVNAGCNSGSGSVKAGTDTLKFGPLALTRKACGPAATGLETAVLKVLDGEVTYTIESDRLSIRKVTDNEDVGLELIAEN